jgi:serine/threonine protein kinase
MAIAEGSKRRRMIVDKRLRVLAGRNQGASYELREGVPMSIGRSQPHNDICLNDPRVSRVHCEIQVDGDTVTIRDLESDGGTHVNGQRAGLQQLAVGDVVRIGDTELGLQILDRPTTTTAAKTTEPHLLYPEEMGDLSGTTFGHFAMGQLLGRGHAGLVYRARDLKANRDVALKLLHPDFPKNDLEMQRFVKTVKTVLPVRHANLVTLYGAGRTGAYSWIAMELVEGGNLATLIQRVGSTPRDDWQEVCRATFQLARALQAAHQQNHFHRNITPQNVLVHSGENFVLNDLVLVKALEGSMIRQITLRAKLVDELPYLPPEQTQGPARIDARSDIYSLGAVMYALAARRPPFDGGSQGETVRKIRHEEPVKPRRFLPSIPPVFEKALLKMLAKKPEDRFQTVGELLQQLEQVEADCRVAG